jgi:hypothetical protein
MAKMSLLRNCDTPRKFADLDRLDDPEICDVDDGDVQPLCEFCLKQDKHTPATIAGHIEPHGGDINKFLRGPLRSLSLGCHNKKWSEDRRGFGSAVGLDGYPIDPRHPHNTPSASPLTHDWSDAAMASPPDEEAKPVAVPARATALPSLLARRKRSVTR